MRQGAGYAQLADSVRALVLDGRLPLHVRLPSERDLASALDVSRTTVTSAYDALRSSGYATSKQGSGTWTSLPDSRAVSDHAAPWAPFAPVDDGLINLAQASPRAPAQSLHEAYETALSALPRYASDSGYYLRGVPAVCEAVADRFTARGLPTSPDQILITAGAQHALTLIVALEVRPGDRVLVEHPTYPNTLESLRLADARTVPVPLTDDGWDVGAVAAATRQTSPRVAVLIPDFHNPTGLLATTAERTQLVEQLTRSKTLAVIDESLVELNLDVTDQPAPFASFGSADSTVTIGSVDKAIWGGIRVGWIRATPAMIRRLALVRAANDLSSAVLEQLAVAHLMPRLDTILASRRAELRDQRDALADALARHLPSWRFRVPGGGLVLWADLGLPVSTPLVHAAEQHGVALASGARFGIDWRREWGGGWVELERRIRLPYTAPANVLADVTERIAAAFHTIASRAPTPPDTPLT